MTLALIGRASGSGGARTLEIRPQKARPGSAVSGPGPRFLRPDFERPRPPGPRRPADQGECHGSGEGGSDPLIRWSRPLARIGPQPVLGGRSLPRRVWVVLGMEPGAATDVC